MPKKKKNIINLPIVTAVHDHQPSFIDGEANSISVHLRKLRAHFNNLVSNMNTSTFSHPVQNSSSYTLKELFGGDPLADIVGQAVLRNISKPRTTNITTESIHESQRGNNKSDHSHSQQMKPQGGGDPGGSDGDDSDNGGGSNDPHRGARRAFSPRSLHKNLFDMKAEETNSSNLKPPKLQFDSKLKLEAILVWDRNPKGLR